MIINHDLKFVFVHIPKTGGNSVLRPLYNTNCPEGDVVYNQDLVNNSGKALYPWNFAHNHSKVNRYTIDDELGYFSFSFVRNPWDRMVSLYHWGFRLSQFTGAYVDPDLSFYDFAVSIKERSYSPGHLNSLAVSQTKFLGDQDGPVVEFIGKMERMQEDMNYVCDRLEIPHVKCRVINKNADRLHEDYRLYYDDKSVDLVAEIYSDDVENFGYSFE